jgi:hypothetical protein
MDAARLGAVAGESIKPILDIDILKSGNWCIIDSTRTLDMQVNI